MINYTLIFCFAFLAGFIDSIVGGGGLIQMPALLILFPALPIPTLMGTNKFAAFSGTSISTIRYAKQTEVHWNAVLPAVLIALVFSFTGAHIVSSINKDYIKVIVLCLLIIVAIYTFMRKDFGLNHAPKLNMQQTLIYSLITGATLGFYDGFFGPGTGSFLIVIYISLFGFSFLIASASAKLVNCATNFAALAYFICTKQVNYQLAIPVAIFNMTGAFIGAKLAIKKGSEFVRNLFLFIVSAMILKFGYDVITK
jgi:uncharacterized membrane protein YfcA